jgi:hypothetical protein
MAAKPETINVQISESTWNGVYSVGGVSSLLALTCGLIQVMLNIIGVGVMQIQVPATVVDWFMLLQTHKLIGLNDLTLFQIPLLIFLVPMFLALYVALYRTNPIHLTIAMLLGFLGVAIYLSSNTVFSILSLSNQYAAATTEVEKSMLLAAGQAMLATYGGSGMDVGLFLFILAVFMISVIMLQGNVFSPGVGYTGILAAVVALEYYISTLFTPNAIFFYEVSGLFLFVWILLISRRLFQLEEGKEG